MSATPLPVEEMEANQCFALRVNNPSVYQWFKTLYDTPFDPTIKHLPLGPMLHNENILDLRPSMEDLFIRVCYDDVYTKMSQTLHDLQRDVFITGQNGVGKSFFRSYVLWRQIQEAKVNQQTSLFVIARSPRYFTPSFMILIANGELKYQLVFKKDLGELTLQQLPLFMSYDVANLPIYCHVDVCESDGTLLHRVPFGCTNTTRCVFYVSDSDERCHSYFKDFKATAFTLPSWSSLDGSELVNFYLSMKLTVHKEGLFEALLPHSTQCVCPTDLVGASAVSANRLHTDTTGELVYFCIDKTIDAEGSITTTTTIPAWCSVPRSVFATVIAEEAHFWYHVPKVMFRNSSDKKLYLKSSGEKNCSVEKYLLERKASLSMSRNIQRLTRKYDK